MAGYSGTPLATKLGIRPGTTLVLLDAPEEFYPELPDGVTVRRRLGGRAGVVVLFARRRADLARRIEAAGRAIAPAGGLWVAWPKRSSGVGTDMTDHAVRQVALPLGLVDNKVCAIDDTWTAVRLVWRRSLRQQQTTRP